MNFVLKLLELFKPRELPKREAPQLPEPRLPANSLKLIREIENKELKELKENIYILSVNINGLLTAYNQQNEMLNQILTLQEEMLYQLDQGNIVMVKAGALPKSNDDRSEVDDLLNTPIKKKENLN